MSSLIESLTTLFNFLFAQLSNFANFLQSNVIGQIIIGIIFI